MEQVEAEAFIEGVDLKRAMFRVVLALMEKARAGDVNAAKLLVERFYGKDPEALLTVNQAILSAPGADANNPHGAPGPEAPSSEEIASFLDDLAGTAARIRGGVETVQDAEFIEQKSSSSSLSGDERDTASDVTSPYSTS